MPCMLRPEVGTGAELVAVVDCEPEDEPLLARLRDSVPTRVSFGPPGADAIVERAAGAAVLVTLYTYTRIGAAVLGRLPELKLVATRTAGYSHIDVDAAAAGAVSVAVVPGAATQSVAEFTFGAVLALGRRLPDAREATRSGRWEYREFRGFELAGKTLGVVGLGRIGLRVAELGAAFGMRVLGWSRHEKGAPGIEQTSLEDLLARADVVSVNVALNDDTRGLVDAARLALMRPGAILVNTARGGIVDDEALRERLEAGLLGGGRARRARQRAAGPGGAGPARRGAERARHAARRVAYGGGAPAPVRRDDGQRAGLPRGDAAQPRLAGRDARRVKGDLDGTA